MRVKIALTIFRVAPLAGAWIEMCVILRQGCASIVAPLAGAWIEIIFFHKFTFRVHVAPLAGAWIEI